MLRLLRAAQSKDTDNIYRISERVRPDGSTYSVARLTPLYGAPLYGIYSQSCVIMSAVRKWESEQLWYITVNYPDGRQETSWVNSSTIADFVDSYVYGDISAPVTQVEYLLREPRTAVPLTVDFRIDQIDQYSVTLTRHSPKTGEVSSVTTDVFDLLAKDLSIIVPDTGLFLNAGLTGGQGITYYAADIQGPIADGDIVNDILGVYRGLMPAARPDPQGVDYSAFKSNAIQVLAGKYGARLASVDVRPYIYRKANTRLAGAISALFTSRGAYPPPRIGQQ